MGVDWEKEPYSGQKQDTDVRTWEKEKKHGGFNLRGGGGKERQH